VVVFTDLTVHFLVAFSKIVSNTAQAITFSHRIVQFSCTFVEFSKHGKLYMALVYQHDPRALPYFHLCRIFGFHAVHLFGGNSLDQPLLDGDDYDDYEGEAVN